MATSTLFELIGNPLALPTDYGPVRPRFLDVERIVLARGSVSTPERCRYVEQICALFPSAEIRKEPELAHNRIDLGIAEPAKRKAAGKKTLVFGEHKSAVRFSEEEGNTCPNYWHFSPTGFCFYNCRYCYLAGTLGVWHSPTIKIYVNLGEIVSEIDRHASKIGKPTAFYLGKLQDGLSLEPLTGYQSVLVPFFARHPHARQVILTKTDEVGRLLELDHGSHTTLSWSLNPPEIAEQFESDVPDVGVRIEVMKLYADHGYPVRAVLMPVIPVDGWEDIYPAFVRHLLEQVPIARLTIGGICSYKGARRLLEWDMGKDNDISIHFEKADSDGDGRMRYPRDLRVCMYRTMIDAAKRQRPDLEVALCLEEPEVWTALGLTDRMGKCNCVL